jgi:hypothetical protein
MNQPHHRFAAFLSLIFVCSLAPFAAGGTYDKIEASFDLPQVLGNPFDFTVNDVKVTFVGPDGKEITLPAFFDGGQTWRVRLTPTAIGKYSIRSVTLNGQDASPQKLGKKEFDVSGSAHPGFVRIDPNNKFRFIFDDGSTYYPVGYDLGWRQANPPMPPLTVSLGRMGKAGVNWTRIWMNHWDGKNLDWAETPADQPPLGKLSLTVAKHWDEIIDAADANDIHFQIDLQHHGQYSTRADVNWPINPWNKANGGWLDNPVQFFSDPKAIALTKAKYRYIIARWSYTPSIMAWELFNEIENADAFEKDLDHVASWHAEMAKFIREQDPYHHLITTSSRVSEPKLWPATDYYQAHVYPPDILSSIANLEAENLDRAYFYGEIGTGAPGMNEGEAVHQALWGSLMSKSSGAAEYWLWYGIEPNNELFHFTAAQGFIHQSGLLDKQHLKPLEVSAQTDKLGPLVFGPGSGWAPSKSTEFTVKPSGFIEGLGGMSAYLQGNDTNKHHAMFPQATFNVTYPSAGTFAVRVDEMTGEGANLQISVDGQKVTSLDLGAPPAFNFGGGGGGGQNRPRPNPRLNASLEVPIAAGAHSILLQNNGPDWIHIRDFTLTPYAPQLAVLAKGDSDFAVLWIYRRAKSGDPISGKLTVPGLADGSYHVVWWDTYQSKILKDETLSATAGSLTLTTPPIAQDVAVWIAHQAQ